MCGRRAGMRLWRLSRRSEFRSLTSRPLIRFSLLMLRVLFPANDGLALDPHVMVS
jgi:hypothetical protein